MLVCPLPNGVEVRPARREVVEHEESAARQQSQHELLSARRCGLEAAGVEEQALERATWRKQLAPVPDEELDVVEVLELLGGDRGAIRILLDGDDAPRRPR